MKKLEEIKRLNTSHQLVNLEGPLQPRMNPDIRFCLDWMRRAAEVLNDITDDRVYRDGDPVYDAAAELLKELEG